MRDELGRKVGQEVMRETESQWIVAAEERDLFPADLLDWIRDTISYREPVKTLKGTKRLDTPAAKHVQAKAVGFGLTMFGMQPERREISGRLRVEYALDHPELEKLIDEVTGPYEDETKSPCVLPTHPRDGKGSKKTKRGNA